MVIGSTIYSCTFLKEINSDGTFHIPEHYQYDLLYWPLWVEYFFAESWCVSILLSFQLRLLVANPYIDFFFYLSMLLCTHHTFFSNFYMVSTSQPIKIWWQVMKKYDTLIHSVGCGGKEVQHASS